MHPVRGQPSRKRTALLPLAATLTMAAAASQAASTNPQLIAIAQEAREAIAVIDWFYVEHRACPQPSRPGELEELQAGLGDGYSIDRQGQFVSIRGISMAQGWLYYTSPAHPDRCTLWRKLGWDPALIWRRGGGSTRWSYDPGDGGAERPITLRSGPSR
jgi:hypothetical protein